MMHAHPGWPAFSKVRHCPATPMTAIARQIRLSESGNSIIVGFDEKQKYVCQGFEPWHAPAIC